MTEPLTLVVASTEEGQRLDLFLVRYVSTLSRAKLRRVIDSGGVQIDQEVVRKPSYRLRTDQQVSLVIPESPPVEPQAEDIPLEILFEDEHLAAINKPPGMVVHPSKGHWSGTLTAALAFHFSQLSQVGGPTRPGIVHRLDRDTSGVIVVAKNDRSHVGLAEQFQNRSTVKEYLAIVLGTPDRDRDLIDQPIGPHPYQREKMAIRGEHPRSRTAVSEYEVLERFRGFAAVKVTPKTGRTHQIRLHLTHIGHAVLCDKLYGGRSQISRGEITGTSISDDLLLDRQALHACSLQIRHPVSGELHHFKAPLPTDIQSVLDLMREHRGS